MNDYAKTIRAGLAGAGIAALDLGLLARRFPGILALPQGRQWADHLAYGLTVALLLGRRRRSAGGPLRSAPDAAEEVDALG